jgi:hypothetical protein
MKTPFGGEGEVIHPAPSAGSFSFGVARLRAPASPFSTCDPYADTPLEKPAIRFTSNMLDFTGYAGSTFAAYLRARVLILIPLCVIVTWLYNRCGKTILSAALFHSAFNIALDFIPTTGAAVWMISVLALAVIVSDRMWQKTGKEAWRSA